MENLFTRLEKFIDQEYDTQIQQIKTIWKKPLEERVQEGEAIAQLSIEKIDGPTLVARCPINLSKFREGSNVLLHKGDVDQGLSCEILKDLGSHLLLKAGFKVSFSGIKGEDWILDNDLIDIRHILKKVLSDAESSALFSDYVHGLLNQTITPAIDEERMREAINLIQDAGLNDKQHEAFVQSFASTNYYMIQGPPGTGKTWVLARLAQALAKKGERVLLTAFTHRAINNALVKTAVTTGYRKIIKIGQATRAEGLTYDQGFIPNFEYYSETPFSPDEPGLIIGATCFAVRGSRLKEVEFDTVIFDEAGQITLPLAFAGMLSGRRHIFIGDHQQMPPVVVAEHADKEASQSIFNALIHTEQNTVLDVTYRMNRWINAFPSKQFYDGKLISDASCAENILTLKEIHPKAKPILDPDKPEIFVQIDHQSRSMRSEEEARLCSHLVQLLIAGGVDASEIAIIAPYRAQGRLIREWVRKSKNGRAILKDLIVDTVERIQGQERDVVIISLTTSDPTHAANRAAFFFQPNRLNVSLTRARKKRIVMGSKNLLEARTGDPKMDEWIEVFRNFYHSTPVVPVRFGQPAGV